MILEQEINDLIKSAKNLLESFNSEDIKQQIELLNKDLESPNIWDNPEKATSLNKNFANKSDLLNLLNEFESQIENLEVAKEIGEEFEIASSYQQVLEQKTNLENQKFLNGKFDDQGALLSIHSGAGGVDAQDWAAMLLAMYQTFAKNMNWQVNMISLSSGEEGGVKSATLEIKGLKVYGFLKEEAGVHRLVRLSPYNSAHTRETSFALVEVIPDNVQEEISIQDIPEEDLRWDTFMSGGKGGQSVNTTYSAVRVVHIPTNISVVCQNERNQIQNRQIALKYLKNKLAVLEAKKQEDLRLELRGEFHSAEWGNHIRSYVLHPYKLVKDNRSGFETNNTEAILEYGNLLEIIWSVKRSKK
jgi:peptide chain release factor 2